MQYDFKTKPFAHQLDWWEKTRDAASYAILWEQGTGKSKLTVDTAGWLYKQGKISALVVVAPNGVHRNWTANEVPTHLPDDVPWRGVCWNSQKANNVGFQNDIAEALNTPGLLVLAMNYDALMTKAGDEYLMKVLTKRRSMMVLDESARIKNPGAQRTKRALARGKYADYRRVLTGTPVANSPFDIYSQFMFLDPTVWRAVNCGSFAAFKTYFGVWADRMDPRSGRMFRELLKYKNLEQLAIVVDHVGTRVTKADVLDLPPKLFTKRYFDLGPEQAKVYRSMKDTFGLQLAAGDVTAMLAITQLLRFQQITSGFVVTDDDRVAMLPENPRLELLTEIVEDTQGKMIIWAKFTHEIDQIMSRLADLDVSCVRYDGQTNAEERAEAIERFQHGTARAFVANAQAAGEGLTLHAATTVIYYSNSFKLTDRLQSEDRAHRIGQYHPVTYIDLVGTDTVDEKIVTALRNKLDVASIVTGDTVKAWI
jgi:SNF2 family DNA or RNA helicase